MTVEKFYETLKTAIELDEELKLQLGLDSIKDALHNIATSGAQPQHQSALASALATFSAAAKELGNAFTPIQSASIAEMGGAEFFDPAIADTVKETIVFNAMTPSVASDFLKDLASRRSSFLKRMRQTLAGLESLGVREVALKPGSADMAFLIPRDLFDNEVGRFAKELVFINRLIEDCAEALTGERAPAVLEGLSSSVPSIAIGAGLGLVAYLANLVNKFLEGWERIERIRKIRTELSQMGIEGSPIETLTKQIANTVKTVVDESVGIALANYKGETGRKNELENALKQDARRLFGQIERGLTIQFRAEPDENAKEADRNALQAMARFGREIQFPQPEKQPMLLEEGEILEGELPEIIATSASVAKSATKKVRRKRDQKLETVTNS